MLASAAASSLVRPSSRARRGVFRFPGPHWGGSGAKRDLPDAIAIAGSLQDQLQAPIDVLLRRAQQALAVRADVGTSDLIVLLKGMLRSLLDTSASGAVDPALRDRLFAVLADGLRG